MVEDISCGSRDTETTLVIHMQTDTYLRSSNRSGWASRKRSMKGLCTDSSISRGVCAHVHVCGYKKERERLRASPAYTPSDPSNQRTNTLPHVGTHTHLPLLLQERRVQQRMELLVLRPFNAALDDPPRRALQQLLWLSVVLPGEDNKGMATGVQAEANGPYTFSSTHTTQSSPAATQRHPTPEPWGPGASAPRRARPGSSAVSTPPCWGVSRNADGVGDDKMVWWGDLHARMPARTCTCTRDGACRPFPPITHTFLNAPLHRPDNNPCPVPLPLPHRLPLPPALLQLCPSPPAAMVQVGLSPKIRCGGQSHIHHGVQDFGLCRREGEELVREAPVSCLDRWEGSARER